jgi:hypothetical protein
MVGSMSRQIPEKGAICGSDELLPCLWETMISSVHLIGQPR